MSEQTPYNPLDKVNLGQSVTQALFETEIHPLNDTERVKGAGIYAIYYTGDFPAYGRVSDKNRDGKFDQPIYVGKAIPKGGRKGGLGPVITSSTALRSRLRKHATSVEQVSNLDIRHFHYRWLVVDDIWIPLGENMLIEQFKPIWNVVIDGFGNNDPGSRRSAQYKSSWDVLHPGRAFAAKLADSGLKPEVIVARIENYLAGRSVPLIEPETEEVDENDVTEE